MAAKFLLVSEIGKSSIKSTLFPFKSKIKNMKIQMEKLKEIRREVLQVIEPAEKKLQVIGTDVCLWLLKVDEILREAEEVLKEGARVQKGCIFPYVKTQNLSRRAKKTTLDIDVLLDEGKFKRISYPPPSPTETVKEFESRRSTTEGIMAALKDGNVNMIGICGEGGVGKTTMVKEIGKRAKENNLFDEVVMAVVSQEPDLKKIQHGIAELLGLKLDAEESLLARAGLLCDRMKTVERILVILDDVWEPLNLEEVGIPFADAHKGCKIVMTSRKKDVCDYVCDDADTRKKFTIEVLIEDEAWNLFKEMAGITIDPTDPKSTQRLVAAECGRLPLTIVTVGRALRYKIKPSWDDALQQLRNSIGINFGGVDGKVFSSLELSYNYLQSNEAKKFFLHCCLYLEHSKIPIEDLVRYGVGFVYTSSNFTCLSGHDEKRFVEPCQNWNCRAI